MEVSGSAADAYPEAQWLEVRLEVVEASPLDQLHQRSGMTNLYAFTCTQRPGRGDILAAEESKMEVGKDKG